MSPLRFLGLAGLVAAAMTSLGGFCNVPALVGIAGAVMFVANAYAFMAGK